MIVRAYWQPGAWFIVSAREILAGPFGSHADAVTFKEQRTTRTWRGLRGGWVVTERLTD